MTLRRLQLQKRGTGNTSWRGRSFVANTEEEEEEEECDVAELDRDRGATA